jgi:hypothetical protein
MLNIHQCFNQCVTYFHQCFNVTVTILVSLAVKYMFLYILYEHVYQIFTCYSVCSEGHLTAANLLDDMYMHIC